MQTDILDIKEVGKTFDIVSCTGVLHHMDDPMAGWAVLADCIHTYQNMGVWTRHIDITDDGYNAMLDIFEYDGMLKTRYAYDQVCARPPVV